MDSQADTYIEECFEQKCLGYKDINQWRADKDCFSSHTDITSFDFQHYSMHDKTHSIAILRNIEMVLGKERVRALNASDLWLLLEVAYCHDIGMSVTYEKLREIWESEDFQEFIKGAMDSNLPDRKKSARFYEKLNNMVHDRKALENASNEYETDDEDSELNMEFDDILDRKSWAVVCERYIMMLYTEYIRKKHPENSRAFMLLYGENERYIPQRMYGIVASVAMLHGEDFETIFEMVSYDENGFGAERMHPQFAAAMLRLGDLLDMDSNRFNIRMMKHLGLMPIESMLHLKKHKAMTHLSYSESMIQAEARSEEFDVCKTAQQWFDWLDEEVKNLICHWNQIAPSELSGCRMNRCELKVFYKNQKFDSRKQTKFVADSERVYKMLIGDNIYKSRLDFIREYLQNAFDASKMSLWLDIKKDKTLWNKYTPENITPYDIPKSWFEQYPIEIDACIDWDRQELVLSIQDHGVGMEGECVKALSHIAGDSWQRREAYAKEMSLMPSWLKPTAGFGIGIQSAFMTTDSVEFRTRTEHEQTGRKICIEGVRKGGRVSEYGDMDTDVEKGTKVVVRIGILGFLKEAMQNKSVYLDRVSGNVYDRNELPGIVSGILTNYIRRIADYALLPISVRYDGETKQMLGMKWRQSSEGEKVTLGEEVKLSDDTGREWAIRYSVTENEAFLWISEKKLMVIYNDISLIKREEDSCYYKGILISEESRASSADCVMQILYHAENVSEYLMINRDKFRQNCSGMFEKDIMIYKYLYIKLLANNIKEFKTCSVSRAMALEALTYYGIGRIGLDNTVSEVLMDSISNEVAVIKIDLAELVEIRDQLAQMTGQGIVEALYDAFLEKNLFKYMTMGIREFVETLKGNDYLLYEAKKQPSPVRISPALLVKELLNGTAESDVPDNPEYIYDSIRKGAYIISEKEVCRILDEQGTERSYINIKKGSQYIMRIACVGKSRQGGETELPRYGDRIKEFVRVGLKDVIMNHTDRVFPLALCVGSISKEDAEYKLWVEKVYPGTTVFSLDKNSIVNRTADEEINAKYLIFPVNQWIWATIDREIERNGAMSKKKYDEIVRKEEELKLLIEWTYCYQDKGMIKLKRPEIWKQYLKILDLLYNEYF